MADERNAKLVLSIETKGGANAANDVKALSTGATTLQQELGKISRSDQLQKIGTDMGNLAKKTKDVGGAVAELDKKLKELGADKDEIAGVANAFNEAQSGGGGISGFLKSGGSALRSLPSTQIPGTELKTDAIANFARVGGALGEVAQKIPLVTAATTALTPALGASAAGFFGIVAVLGPAVITIGALALAVKALGDQSAEESKKINSIVDAQRKVGEEIAGGLTSGDAAKKLEELKKLREDESARVDKLNQSYKDNIESAGVLTPVLKLASGAEDALAGQIDKSKNNVTDYDTQIAALTKAMQDGSLSANDAAEAEKKLAAARDKKVLSDADAAGKELATQQKALASTEEQNQKRLSSIDDEKAVIQKQIDVLTDSKDTSEAVTEKIASLNGQLGALGKESDFIKNTALAVSKQRDAEKKAQKDAEDAAKKAEQAQTQYTKAVENASRSFENSVQDIGTRLAQTLSDDTLKLNRDLDDIGTKYRRDQFDLTIKANRAELDAALQQTDELAKIRETSNKDEINALEQGDFKALFLARQKQAEDLKQETLAVNRNAAKRKQDAQDARDDLLRNAERTRSDRVQAYVRQETDARTANARELQQAQLTRQRALQIASDGLNAELKQLGQYYQTRLKMEKDFQSQMTGGARQPANNKSPFGAAQNFSAGGLAGIIRK